jgi:Transposase and inactivated derivatives
MGSTYTSLHYHVIFSTKERKPLIRDWAPELHAYLGGSIRGIGGVEDHVHLLVSLKPTHCLSDVVGDLKKQATIWTKENHATEFSWQDGYAAFTVGPKGIGNVVGYIAGQAEHHKKFSYVEELRKLLDEAGVPYDERFLT